MDMNYQTFECSKTLYVANTSLAKKLNLQVAIWIRITKLLNVPVFIQICNDIKQCHQFSISCDQLEKIN